LVDTGLVGLRGGVGGWIFKLDSNRAAALSKSLASPDNFVTSLTSALVATASLYNFSRSCRRSSVSTSKRITSLSAADHSRFITVSSAAGIKAVPGLTHYCASKFGVVGLTNALAVELGEFGIRVNSIHPYGVDTPMGNDLSMYQILQDHPHYIHSLSPGALPTDSLIKPDQISDVVVWLASDASSLLTAAQVPVDKGYLKI
jgi:NAD(P)-dependent dehydrogenase (short-subunit alcohol dehydrogenase family)